MHLTVSVSPRLWITIGLSLSIVGVFLSAVLLAQHGRGDETSSFLAAVCRIGSGCDKVLQSRWAVFPPRTETDENSQGSVPKEREPSIPVAALGLFYFSILLVWFGAVGVPGASRLWLHTLVLLICALSCLGSLGFISIMFFSIGAWCPLCLGSHLSNFFLLGSFAFLRPFSNPTIVKASGGKGKLRPLSGSEIPRGHPETRVLLLTLALAGAICFAEWKAYSAYRLDVQTSQWEELIERHVKDPDLLAMTYFRGEKEDKEDLKIREDDPIIDASPGTRMTLVIFSQIECPHCAKFDKFLFEEIKQLYEGHLRIVYKHYPMSQECNPYVKTTHPHACTTASALEAARLQGGSEMFWELQHYLLKERNNLSRLDYEEVAKKFNLDPRRFKEDMNSERVKRRLREDVDIARRLGVKSTPTIFLNSRRVDGLMRDSLGFWKVVSKGFRKKGGDKNSKADE